MNRVLEQYKTNVIPELTEQFKYTSVMQVPKLVKIVINMGVGDSISNSKLLDAAVIFFEAAGVLMDKKV